MEDFLVWIVWAAVIGGSIASSASKAKKKREEEARRAARSANTTGADGQASPPVIMPATTLRPVFEPSTAAWPRSAFEPSTDIQPSEYMWMDNVSDADRHALEDRVDEIAAYERLVSQRTGRSTLASTTGLVADSNGSASADKDTQTHFDELMDGNFDLRRAVVEAEILFPKYV